MFISLIGEYNYHPKIPRILDNILLKKIYHILMKIIRKLSSYSHSFIKNGYITVIYLYSDQ